MNCTQELSIMNLIGKKTPAFNLPAIKEGAINNLSEKDLLGSYSVFFFYPLDFTFVCPTEIHALQAKMSEFDKRGARVFAISVDSIHAHRAWLNTPKNSGGVAGVTYTLVSDMRRELTEAFGVLDQEEGVALRGTFILDRENVVQHASINNLSFGRNIDEIIRMVDAISFVEEHGDHVCPANWSAGEKTMQATPESVSSYLREQ